METLNYIKATVTLIRKVNRIWSSSPSHHDSQSASEDQIKFKNECIEYWECKKVNNNNDGQISVAANIHQQSVQQIKCMMTQEYFDRKEVKAAHLWPKKLADTMNSLVGLRGNLVNNVRNGLLLCKSIEAAYDRGQVCFIYNPFSQTFQFRILDASLRRKRVAPGSTKTFQQLDGKALWLPSGKYPYRRVLASHAQESIWHAKEEFGFRSTDEEDKAIETALTLSDRVSEASDEEEDDEEPEVEEEFEY